jgi:hypothetical protein
MIISKYGISLIRLKVDDIELVRQKRNSDEIRKNMVFKDIISPNQQLTWFKSINNIYNNYFIIEYDKKKIGLINGKNIDFEQRTSEGGIFFWENTIATKFIPALCSSIMNDYTFILNEFNTSYIKILNSNLSAISYNKQIGYKKCNKLKTDGSFSWFELNKEDYFNNTKKIRKGIGLLTGDFHPLNDSNFSFEDDTDEELDILYKPLPQYLKDKINVGLNRERRKLI